MISVKISIFHQGGGGGITVINSETFTCYWEWKVHLSKEFRCRHLVLFAVHPEFKVNIIIIINTFLSHRIPYFAHFLQFDYTRCRLFVNSSFDIGLTAATFGVCLRDKWTQLTQTDKGHFWDMLLGIRGYWSTKIYCLDWNIPKSKVGSILGQKNLDISSNTTTKSLQPKFKSSISKKGPYSPHYSCIQLPPLPHHHHYHCW